MRLIVPKARSSRIILPHGGDSAGGGGGFATPDILNTASFETNATEGGLFDNGGGGSPDWTRDNAWSSIGSWSVKMPVPATPSADAPARNNWFNWTNHGKPALDEVFLAADVFSTCSIDSVLKYIRFFSGDQGTNLGGFEMGSGTDILMIWTDRENVTSGRYVVPIGYTEAAFINRKVRLEMQYRRNGDASGWPMQKVWIDGVVQAMPDGPVGGSAPASNGYWLGGALYQGERQSTVKVGAVQLMATLNQGNAQVGSQWMDNISISTQRIGP